MTITNDLDSNLVLLSQINSDGKTQSETLNLLLTSTSHTSFIKGSHSIRLLEFIKNDIITHQLHLKDNPSPTDYLNRIEIAVEFFEINLDYFPHQLGDLESFNSLLTLITFLVTILSPIQSIELRLMVLNSKIFKTFTQSMQFLLRLQIISSCISIEQLSKAKSFFNQTKSKYKKLSNLPEFKSLQETLLKVKQAEELTTTKRGTRLNISREHRVPTPPAIPERFSDGAIPPWLLHTVVKASPTILGTCSTEPHPSDHPLSPKRGERSMSPTSRREEERSRYWARYAPKPSAPHHCPRYYENNESGQHNWADLDVNNPSPIPNSSSGSFIPPLFNMDLPDKPAQSEPLECGVGPVEFGYNLGLALYRANQGAFRSSKSQVAEGSARGSLEES